MSPLSTRTLKPSLGNSFVTEYLSSVEAIPVSHSVPLATASASQTQDTSGLGSKTELNLCDPTNVSLKMWTGTYRWDSTQSSATWKSLVTKRRSEFSRRLKQGQEVLPTNAKESSSWPTASTRDHKGGYSGGRIRRGKVSMDTLDVVVQAYLPGGLLDPAKDNTTGNPQEYWRTPSSSDGEGGIMEMRPGTAGKYKLRDHVHAKWATPSAFDWNQPETKEQWEKRAATQAEKGVNLHLPLKSQAIQVGNNWPTPRAQEPGTTSPGYGKGLAATIEGKYEPNNWATPQASDHIEGVRTGTQSNQKCLGRDLARMAAWATPNTLDHMDLRSPEALLRQATTTRKGRTSPANLREQVDPTSVEIYKQASWPTPTAMEAGKIGNQPNFGQPGLSNHPSIVGIPTRDKALKSDSTAQQKEKITAKLNPRFVEALMGLPVGWVMPSCATPMTTELTNSDVSATEWCQANAPMLIEHSLSNFETTLNA